MSILDLYRKPGHLIRRAQQIAVAIFMEECAEFEITPVQYAALLAIHENPGIDATRLSAVIAFDRSTLGSVLERLEAKALVARSGTAEDKRVKTLSVTATGRKLLTRIAPAVERAQQRILAPLNMRDRGELVRLLDALVEMNNDASRAPLRAVSRKD